MKNLKKQTVSFCALFVLTVFSNSSLYSMVRDSSVTKQETADLISYTKTTPSTIETVSFNKQTQQYGGTIARQGWFSSGFAHDEDYTGQRAEHNFKKFQEAYGWGD